MSPPTANREDCAVEPIERPVTVQPHGVMLVLGESTRTLLSASDSSARLLPGFTTARETTMKATLGERLSSRILEHLREGDLSEPIRWEGPTQGPWAGRMVDVILHRSSARLVIEFEATNQNSQGQSVSLSATRAAIDRLRRGESAGEVLTLLTRTVRKVTGFDRVMVYRFDREWHGEVIAEDRRPALEPFLGLRYPESDIPAQARLLYTLNRLRFIVDARALASRLVPPVPDDGHGELDMTYAALRSVSPVHLEYLAGMGVRASMSVSMLRNGPQRPTMGPGGLSSLRRHPSPLP